MYSCHKYPNGFTLVELAIVLMIIGLLIGGILRGQELINNARLTMTMQQLKSFDAAAITFKDSYGQLPGDLTNPSTRLANCTTTPCSSAGNGNGAIDPNYGTNLGRGGVIGDETGVSDERNNFWSHMVKANLVNGNPNPDPNVWQTIMPQTPFKRGGIAAWGYLGINGYGVLGEDLDNGAMPTQSAAALDRKMDDGNPQTGDVKILVNGVSALATCATGSGAAATYTSGGTCDVFLKAGF